jgi:hypothetical protein
VHVPVVVLRDGGRTSDHPIWTDTTGTLDLGRAPEAIAVGNVKLEVLDSDTLWSGDLGGKSRTIDIVRDDLLPLRIQLVDAEGVSHPSWSIRGELRGTSARSVRFDFRKDGTFATWLEREAMDTLELLIQAYDGSVQVLGPLRALGTDIAVPAPPDTARVDVQVVNARGSPVAGRWMIDLQPVEGPSRVPGMALRGLADAKGRASIFGVPAGLYRWVARLGAKTIEGDAPLSVAPSRPAKLRVLMR